MEQQSKENLPSREKYWDELNDQQKVDRMRQEVKSMQRQLTSTVVMMEKLMNHQHSIANGEILTSLQTRNDQPEGYRRYRDDKYF